jgi:ribosome-associated protein
MDETVEVGPAGIRLGRLLKLVGAVDTGGDVKGLLAEGEVRVDGEVETRRGAQLIAGQVVSVHGATYRLA